MSTKHRGEMRLMGMALVLQVFGDKPNPAISKAFSLDG